MTCRALLWSLACAAGLAWGGEPPAAPERVTEIMGALKGKAWSNGYTYASGGCQVLTESGRPPIVSHLGAEALKLEVQGRGGDWGVGLARKGWVRWYLDDYLPGGVLEFKACGKEGGEGFRIGLSDSDKDGQGPDQALCARVFFSALHTPLTREWAVYRVPLADLLAAEPKLDLADCDKVLLEAEGQAVPLTVFLREIRFVTRAPERKADPIRLDQLGYRPAARKVAKVAAPLAAFRVVDAANEKVVLEGQSKLKLEADPVSGDSVWEADFSALQAPGRYRLEADGLPNSANFEVREDIYDRLFVDAARFYYLQRCGMALDEAHAGKWAREACHQGDRQALTKDGQDPRDVTGGWHDAGDCNKYPPWVRYPLFMLLDLYDARGQALADGQLGIPEAGNGLPDLLDEAQWELDWLLKMQLADGPRAGAVYDRLHESAAPKEKGKKAERIQEERRLLPPTAEATAVCAAVWARAARTFDSLPGRKETVARYLAAAERACQRLLMDFHAGSGGKAHEKRDVTPQHLITAAAPLFVLTGKSEYEELLTAHLEAVLGQPSDKQATDRFMWAVYDCSVATLACGEREAKGLREKARAMLRAVADRAVETWRKDAYSVPLWNPDHYCWSSNLHIAKMGYYALLAQRFAPREEYPQMAEDGLHYLLGRNAVGMSLVSGYGTRSTQIYHSIFGGSSKAWQPLPPGIIGGGVNEWESHGISAWPAKHYRSDPNNWTLTEPAIYYNAPLVFLTGYFAKLGAKQP